MENSEIYSNIIMTKEEYLSLPCMDEYSKLYKKYDNDEITENQMINNVLQMYRLLDTELAEKTFETSSKLKEEYRPLFPVRMRESGESIYLTLGFVKVII